LVADTAMPTMRLRSNLLFFFFFGFVSLDQHMLKGAMAAWLLEPFST